MGGGGGLSGWCGGEKSGRKPHWDGGYIIYQEAGVNVAFESGTGSGFREGVRDIIT